jgi:type IV pilus assembly protein PilY1
METAMRTGPAWKFWRSALPGFLLAAIVIAPAHAGQVAIATAPLFNSAISLVKPNLLFMLDDSSSMAYNYLPDEVPWDIKDVANPNPLTDSHAVALTSAQCNGVAYDPTVVYSRPSNSTHVVRPSPQPSTTGST